MKWEKFKKELLSLNYTVMLLPHSERKPIHFKIPVWVFGLAFFLLLIFTGTCLFFAGSRYRLAEVQKEKEELEQEWIRLTEEKQAADEENELLRIAQEAQEEELKKLEQEARDMIQELNELIQRENEIRQELGLTQDSFGQGPFETDGEDPESGDEAMDGSPRASREHMPYSYKMDAVQKMASSGRFESLSTDSITILMEDIEGFQSIQDELGLLQDRLAEKTAAYGEYMGAITAKKEAEAEERARKEAVRASIVDTALSYVGGPYVYGGSNPNTGTDCSGFTKYVYEQVTGIGLNRTAASQSTQGHPVSAETARPGDLVFYGSDSISHVAIYIGDGQIVHAANSRKGIIQSDLYYQTPVKIVSILDD